MTTQPHPTDFADLARRGQESVADAFELWNSSIRTGNEQAKNLRRVTDDLFSLADHSIVVGREFVGYLSTVLRISAAGVDTCRELTNNGFNALQSASQWAGNTGR
jgi:hypothetical protein